MHGQEPTYCVHSPSLSQSLSHYFACPSPHPLLSSSSFILLKSPTSHFSAARCLFAPMILWYPELPVHSCAAAPPQRTLQAPGSTGLTTQPFTYLCPFHYGNGGLSHLKAAFDNRDISFTLFVLAVPLLLPGKHFLDSCFNKIQKDVPTALAL